MDTPRRSFLLGILTIPVAAVMPYQPEPLSITIAPWNATELLKARAAIVRAALDGIRKGGVNSDRQAE